MRKLKEVCDGIVWVADSPLLDNEIEKIKDLVIYAKAERHGEYDFGSYKRGYNFIKQAGLLESIEELVFCNDSCYGPVTDLSNLFNKMAESNNDFWGILPNDEIRYHLQSWFLCFKRQVVLSNVFDNFINSVKKEYSVQDVILNYETVLTDVLLKAGFLCESAVKYTPDESYPYVFSHDLTHFPIWLLNQGCPFVKVKALKKFGCNFEGVGKTHDFIKNINEKLYSLLPVCNISKDIKFSIIMPTYNRKDIIDSAINSVLKQSYNFFELIIVDDGSTDGTDIYIEEHYKEELSSGKIVYLKKKNEGVCKARNYGLHYAKNDWIAYVDSDNSIYPHFLESFAFEIASHPDVRTFYSKFRNRISRIVVGSEFDLKKLVKGNYIDLGTFVHHSSLLKEIGYFDENMTRLVDWDLILRFTTKYVPYFIPVTLMLYNDTDGISRISNSVSYEKNLQYFRNKHKSFGLRKVTTVITSYNHEKYIEQAIRSAVNQKGWFEHEILISDDFSTDRTPAIVDKYCEKYPRLVKSIASNKNLGISFNLKKCFEAATGDYVAILEGDDYWTDDHKLEKQMNFLENNSDCSMVFSKLKLLNETTQRFSSLSRQDNLKKSKLTGEDVINEPSLNFMGNFSCCMFRTKLMKNLPAVLYSTRINEISLSFYLVNYGKIGYISEPLSVYRQHVSGVWTGADEAKQLESGMKCRLAALSVCQDKFKKRLQRIIDEKYKEPLEKVYRDSSGKKATIQKIDSGIRGWVSNTLHNNELHGYLFNIRNSDIRSVVLKIDDVSYECLSDSCRINPKKYLYHRNHGFIINIGDYIPKNQNGTIKLKLIDKETNELVYVTALKL